MPHPVEKLETPPRTASEPLPRSVVLRVPALEEYLLVARLTTSGVLARCTVDVETLEDIKTAVYEACYALVHQCLRPETLELVFCLDGALEARVCALGKRSATPERRPNPLLCRRVLETLVQSACIDSDEGGLTAITLRHSLS